MSVSESDLEHLARLLRLAAMTGREIASTRPADEDEILELVDQAEDVGRQLDAIARRQKPAPLDPSRRGRVTLGKKH